MENQNLEAPVGAPAEKEAKKRTSKNTKAVLNTNEKISLHEILVFIQCECHVPKTMINEADHFSYRSTEGIIESLKPALARYGVVIRFEDDILSIGNDVFYKSVAVLCNGAEEIRAAGFAKFDAAAPRLSGMQITGACATYARKYALGALFALDDSKTDEKIATPDPDSTTAKYKVEQKSKGAIGDKPVPQPAAPTSTVPEAPVQTQQEDSPAGPDARLSILSTILAASAASSQEGLLKPELTPQSSAWGRYVTSTANYNSDDLNTLAAKVCEKVTISAENFITLLENAGKASLLQGVEA